jgi:hypothetical protein
MKSITNYIQEHLVGNILWGYIFTKENLRRIKEIIDVDEDSKEYSRNTYGYLNKISDDDPIWGKANGYTHKPKNKDEYDDWKTQYLSNPNLNERLKKIDNEFTDGVTKNKEKETVRDDLYIRNLQITAVLNKNELTRAYNHMKAKMKNSASRQVLDKSYARLSGKTPSTVDDNKNEQKDKKDKKDKKK